MFINVFSYFDQKNKFQKSGNVIWDHPEYVYNVTTAMMYNDGVISDYVRICTIIKLIL